MPGKRFEREVPAHVWFTSSGRLAQWKSASFTPKRSLVRTQYRPPIVGRSQPVAFQGPSARTAPFGAWRRLSLAGSALPPLGRLRRPGGRAGPLPPVGPQGACCVVCGLVKGSSGRCDPSQRAWPDGFGQVSGQAVETVPRTVDPLGAIRTFGEVGRRVPSRPALAAGHCGPTARSPHVSVRRLPRTMRRDQRQLPRTGDARPGADRFAGGGCGSVRFHGAARAPRRPRTVRGT